MPLLSGSLATTTLTGILRTVVDAKQTGYLKFKDAQQDGCLVIENGILLSARAGTSTGLHALFQFVGWRDAKFEFHERPMPADLVRDLAVYDPQLLITGVAFKVDEQNLLLEAIPGLDDVLRYVAGEALASVEVTPADLGMLVLADGRRTVRDIAGQVGQSPADVAKHLARFCLAGVLKPVTPRSPARQAKSAMAA